MKGTDRIFGAARQSGKSLSSSGAGRRAGHPLRGSGIRPPKCWCGNPNSKSTWCNCRAVSEC